VRILLSLATAITILAMALVLLLTPVWTHFALVATHPDACQPQYLCLFDTDTIVADSDLTVNALMFSGDFDFARTRAPAGSPPFYSADEQSHMRDVRVVLYGFLLLALVSLVFVVASLVRAPRNAGRWKAVSRGGLWLTSAIVVLGVFAFVAFDQAFLLFHEIFFPGGNFSFSDDSNLIRLYPEPFWELSSFALGALAIGGGLLVWFLARSRAAALATA
jgi:integral membrane protein (TIGR01906 family)